jgi:hypothetical protein
MANAFPQPCDEGVIRARPAGVLRAPVSEPWILAATILGSSMAFIDGTVVNVALPALQKNLNDGSRRTMGRRILRALSCGTTPGRRIDGRPLRNTVYLLLGCRSLCVCVNRMRDGANHQSTDRRAGYRAWPALCSCREASRSSVSHSTKRVAGKRSEHGRALRR